MVETWIDGYLNAQEDGRKPSFNLMCNFLLNSDSWPVHIVETGCMRQDNDFGAGMSTLLWDYFADELGATYYSVDISPENVAFAKSRVKFPDNIICSDSVLWLAKSHTLIDLLYLDSYDLIDGDNHESSLHHLFEFLAAKHLMKPEALLVIDDNVSLTKTKAKYIMQYMKQIGVGPLYEGYQMVYQLKEW
jgi:hypothetical protein